jgi:cysteine synthase A
VILADPPGSSLLYRAKYGVCYSAQQSEVKLRRHRYDSIVEGIGLDRITANFDQAIISDGLMVADQVRRFEDASLNEEA